MLQPPHAFFYQETQPTGVGMARTQPACTTSIANIYKEHNEFYLVLAKLQVKIIALPDSGFKQTVTEI